MSQFPAQIDLSSLDGTNGFRLDGANAGDHLGTSVASAGDINGDGFADLILLAPDLATSYVIFGKAGGFDAATQLSSPGDTATAFTLTGAVHSVASAGDLNNDGIADLVLGGASDTTYVVYGTTSGFANPVVLSALNGTDGFNFTGSPGSKAGYSVASAGDVNGDGIDDLIVGAPLGKSHGVPTGAAFVVFGSASGLPAHIDFLLNGTNGFKIASTASDATGYSVASAGDINGDGIDDLLIGAYKTNANGSQSGVTYVLFGQNTGFNSVVNLAGLNGQRGFKISGEGAGDNSGFSVASAGDINGDGFSDLIIGAPNYNSGYGAAYVVFGTNGGFSGNLNLSTLNGSNGFKIVCNTPGQVGFSVASAGDVNGDGFDDLIVGVPQEGGGYGSAYVIFGNPYNNLGTTFNLANINGYNGFEISGEALGDQFGTSVSSAGDLNGDGLADLIVGAPGTDTNSLTDTGTGYVIFGRLPGSSVNRVGTDISQNLVGGNFNDTLEGRGGDDHLYGNGGIDTAVFSGNRTDYLITEKTGPSGTTFTVEDLRDGSPDGTDTLIGIERLQFNGGGGTITITPFFPNLNYSQNDGTIAFQISGDFASGHLGRSVDTAGDVNGDGYDDLIVSDKGSAVVVFGHGGDFSGSLNVSSLTSATGFKISGATISHVASAGDLNGDGYDDIVVGAPSATGNTSLSGASYVVFGKPSGFGTNVDLSTLNGSNGFKVSGVVHGDHAGYSVASAGDVNGDGFDDLIIGAYGASTGNGAYSGASYVVFGKAAGFAANINLATLPASDGFKISGAAAYDASGFSVASAGDVNGDGIGDLIIGAFSAGNGDLSGASYVVFGSTLGFGTNINLSSLNGSNGFKLSGAAPGDQSGWSVSSAGDINGDGFADVIVGGWANGAGASYVVFGSDSGFSANIDLSTLDGTDGFKVPGQNAGDRAGFSVSAAGDVNGDGYDDLLVGEPNNSDNGPHAGRVFLLLGHGGDFAASTDLTPDGSHLVGIYAGTTGDNGGFSVAAAGDVNGDGRADFIIGAPNADVSHSNDGRATVFFGPSPLGPVERTGTDASQNLAGGNYDDKLEGAGGDDHLYGNGGSDTAVFSGTRADYSVLQFSDGNGTTFTVQDLRLGSPDGTDTLSSIEKAQFSDSTLSLFPFASNIDATTLAGNSGFKIVGDSYAYSGNSVAALGDINGDGFGDIAVGGAHTSFIFGKASGFADLDLGSLGNAGVTFGQADNNDQRVFAAGDINGDGLADIAVGSNYYGFVVFGAASGLGDVDLDSLDGQNGFALTGMHSSSIPHSMASAGDINGDGFGDLIVGDRSDGTYGYNTGAAYVLFGHAGGFDSTINVTTLDGTNGFKLLGTYNSQTGFSVASAGDVNGDGIEDIIVGARTQNSYGTAAGAAYVVFGTASGFTATIGVNSLNGTTGFRITGTSYSQLGYSVSSAGDVNGDGFDDLIVGTNYSNGASYIVFGKASFSSSVNVGSLNGTNGFKLSGPNGDHAGKSVASAGDINGDGFDDLIVSAPDADPNGNNSGAVYVVLGHAAGFAANIDLSSLGGSDGFKISGGAASDHFGTSVTAGDINGDGLSDLIVGAYGATANGVDYGGTSYVLLGQLPTVAVDRVGTAGNQTLVGGNLNDTFEGQGGNDHIYGNGGVDTAIFSGALANYHIVGIPNPNGTIYTVQDLRNGSPDGTDTLIGVEKVQFSDGTHNIVDLNHAPTAVAIANATSAIAENTDTTTHIKVADIVVTDPDTNGNDALTVIGADASFFEISGTSLYIKAGVDLDFETQSSYTVAVTVDDASLGASPDATSTNYTLHVTDVNEPPTSVTLSNQITTIDENTDTTDPVKVADITYADQDAGTDTLAVIGDDASSFEIIGGSLYIKAGVVLDFETQSTYSVAVTVDDITVGTTPDATSDTFTLTVNDVNDPPEVALSNTVASLDENTDTGGGIRVADITVTDQDGGTNELGLSGADADSFEIIGSTLYLKSGVELDFETQSSYSVDVTVTDSAIGSEPQSVASYTLDVNDVPEAPTAVDITNQVTSIDENTDSTNPIKVGDIVVTDQDGGPDTLAIIGDDASFFEIIGSGLYLKAGVVLDYETKSHYAIDVTVDDAGIGSSPDATSSTYDLFVNDVNDPPSVALANTVASLDEGTPTLHHIKVADITVTDQDGGTNELGLSGADAASFEIVGNALYLKAGVVLDFETQSSYSVDVTVTDDSIGLTPQSVADYTLTLNNLPEIANFASGPFGDFDGDHMADLLWREADGTVATWQMDGSTIQASSFLGGVTSDWNIQGLGDFNGDGKADILWQNDDGGLLVWQMADSAQRESAFGVGTVPANSHVAGIGDFDGDHKADLLFQDNTTSDFTIDNFSGTPTTIPGPGPGWSVVGVGDFNGDGIADVMFRNPDFGANAGSGVNAAWLMNGTGTPTTVFYDGVPNDWHVVATGDFDGNGTADLFWHEDNGANAVWLTDTNGQVAQAGFFDGVGADWHVVGTGDVNNDQRDDVVWRNDNGATAIWQMNGTNTPNMSFPGGAPSDWATQAHHYEYV